MAEYDITMKKYNGSGYDSLYPKDISQQVMLNNSDVANLIGLSTPNPTILDAVSKVQTNLNWVADNYAVTSIGLYNGNGQYGTDHKNSLTFSFIPKCVIITSGNYATIFLHNSQVAYVISSSESSAINVEWDDSNKSVNWYSSSAFVQMNVNNSIYYYIGIS